MWPWRRKKKEKKESKPQVEPVLSSSSVTNTTSKSNEMKLQYDWYFGPMRRMEAEEILLQPINQHGSFLIRNSEPPSMDYCASVRYEDTVKHYRIRQSDQGEFYIAKRSVFADLAELVAHYRIVADGLCVNFKKPCRRSELRVLQTFDQWEISYSSIKLGCTLSRGMFTEVCEGVWNDTTPVAVKVLKSGMSSKIVDFLRETRIMKNLRHHNILQLFAVCTTGDPVCIVTELIRHGSLLDYLRGDDGRAVLKMPQLIDIAAQIAAGMAYLEGINYVHCDLRARNVLVGDHLKAKICSFGRAHDPSEADEYTSESSDSIPIPVRKWAAPEAALYNRYSIKSDVWSFGVLLTELATYGRIPYPGMSDAEVLAQVERGFRMPQPFGCPDGLYVIMLECWNAVALERPTFEFLQFELENFFVSGVTKHMSPEEKAFYEQATKHGVLKIPRAKLDAIGDEDAGKSCLGDSIMDQPYIEGRPSTKGVLVKMAVRTAVGLKDHWEEMGREKFDKELDKVLARGFVNYASNTPEVPSRPAPDRSQEVLVSGKAEATAAHPLLEPIETSDVIEEKATAVAAPVLESTPHSNNGYDILGHDEFMKTLELDEGKEAFIQDLQQNIEKLRQYEESTIITLMDRGGQEQYLSIHAALMADGMSATTGYVAVIDITKPLDEEVLISCYRLEPGKVIKQKRETRTRADTLRHWIAAIEAAHPHDAEAHDRFLGKDYGVKRPPAVFIVVTRKDQIQYLSKEFVMKQEQILYDMICESEHFADHIVAQQKDPYDVLFRVDNTLSGSGNPDPVVVQLRNMVVQMAQSYCREGEGTPLTYVILEIGLRKVSQIANNKGKVLELNNVFRLAQQACGLSPGGGCTAALKYLSNNGAICFYNDEPGLEEKVFPDPQWLADVMSTFVTVLGKANVDPKLWHDLKKLQSKGVMTWKLAEYLLDKAGVDASVREAILLVLHMFHIIAPSLQHPDVEQKGAFVKVGCDILVPCMVMEEYSKIPPAYESAIRSAEAPSPLFLCPKGFSAFLKPLFYRLITCLVSKYQYQPNIKRHQVILHLPHDLDLEIVYTTMAVIATLYSVDPDEPPSGTVMQRECGFLKAFLVQQLKVAKRRGMDGFKFEVCIHPVKQNFNYKELDYKELACIDNYPSDPLLNRHGERLTRKKCPRLDLWTAEGIKYEDAANVSSQDQLFVISGNSAHTASDRRMGSEANYGLSSGTHVNVGCQELLSENRVFQAVVKYGVAQWFSIGLAMGMTSPEVDACTFNKPSLGSKLEAIIELKVRCCGVKETEECLLSACRKIPDPIIGSILEYIRCGSSELSSAV